MLPGELAFRNFRLEPGYSLRQDEMRIYLCFGAEEIVAEFAWAVRLDTVRTVILGHLGRRLERAASLDGLLDSSAPLPPSWRAGFNGTDRAV